MLCSSLMLERKWKWMRRWSRRPVVWVREEVFLNLHAMDYWEETFFLFEGWPKMMGLISLEILKTNTKSTQMKSWTKWPSATAPLRHSAPPHAVSPARLCVKVGSVPAGFCVCLCVFDKLFFSQALLCLQFSVVGMAGEQRGAFTPICHRLSSLAPVTRTHPHTNTHADTGDFVTAVPSLNSPELFSSTCDLNSLDQNLLVSLQPQLLLCKRGLMLQTVQLSLWFPIVHRVS